MARRRNLDVTGLRNPFGRRGRFGAALIALVSYGWTTLHASWAWAHIDDKTDRATANEVIVNEAAAEAAATPVTPSFDDEARALDKSQWEQLPAQQTDLELPALGEGINASSPLEGDALGNSVPDKEPTSAIDSTPQLQSLPTSSAPISAQAISLPGGAGTVSGMGESFSAQLTTGIATLNVPFAFPPARGEAQPTLSLVYASSNGYGDAGVGWSVAGGVFIARQTDRGTPLYDDRDDWHPNQDRFTFGAQELVPICLVTGGTCEGALPDEVLPPWADGWQYFRARVEGTFLRFFWAPNHRTWRIQSKGGVQFELGEQLDASSYDGGIEANPDRPDQIFRWHLVRQYDAHGAPDAEPAPLPTNIVLYRYSQDVAVKVLSDIFYTPPATDPRTDDLSTYAHHLALKWEERPDRSESYRSGFLQEQRLRLTGVDVTSKPFVGSGDRELVRRYHLRYDPSTHASLLEALESEGRCLDPVTELADGSLPSTNCERLPPLRLGYQRVAEPGAPLTDAQGYEFEPFDETVIDIGDRSPPHSLDETLTALMDVNSDALPDLLVTAPALFGGKHGLFFNGAGGKSGFGKNVGIGVAGVASVDASVLSFANNNVSPLDVDADGTVNLLHMPMVKRYSIFSPEKIASGWSWQGRTIDTASGQDAKINFEQDAPRLARADVNGDGLVDFVFSSATELQTFFSLGRLPGGDTQYGQGSWTSGSSADISNEPVRTCVPWSASSVQFDNPEVRLAEMNGDGLPDIVRLRAGQVLYWPGRGNGFWGTGDRDNCGPGTFGQDRHVQMQNPPQFGTTELGALQLADVNGDGLSDVIEFRVDAVDVYLNDNAQGFTHRYVLDDVPIKPNGSNYVQLTDVDGSGTSDLLWGRAYEYRYIDLTGGVQPYLLTSIDNGLGRLTELAYDSSTSLMLSAEAAGSPWSSKMPLSTPVIVRATVRDRLEQVGRPAGKYVTEYTYRDPVFEGRQREFRGFSSAEVRTIGDANSPTTTARSTFLLGECRTLASAPNGCSPAERWRDNWREPLKGLPAVGEVFDEQGTYLSTTHTRYELRQLYAGRDGRRVSVAYQVGQDTFAYDTANFDQIESAIQLDSVGIFVDGLDDVEQSSVTRRAASGTARLRSNQSFDDYGNRFEATAEGCVEGCAASDEVITSHTEHDLPDGDQSGWLFRAVRSFTTGSVHSELRHEVRQEYDSAGDLRRSFATLSGTLPLDRFHEANDGVVPPTVPVAPPPANASGGIDDPVEIQTIDLSRDVFGSVTGQRMPLGRCRTILFDPDYATLPVRETVFGGALDAQTGCGQHAFVTEALYDRGLTRVLSVTSVTGQPSRFDYDAFGRLIAKTFADPENPGQLAEYAAATYDYLLPAEASLAPYSIVVVRRQDGENANDPAYHESYAYVDGLGRTLVDLSEADPLAGDGGDYVASGVRHYDKKGGVLRAHQPWFVTADPLAFPLDAVPPTAFAGASYDAFGRVVFGFGLDGEAKVFNDYHALSQDTWDAADLALGPHGGSFGTTIVDGHGRTVHAIERVKVGTSLELRHQLREYLPTGELRSITQRRTGAPDVVRWLRYDSLGRLVLNAEPNTSQGFDPDPATDPNTLKAWRYAYDDTGNLVGMSDARGCGVNYFFDTAGRLTAEDYSPCETGQQPYSAPDFGTGSGIEVAHHFDTPDASLGVIADAAGTAFTFDASLYWGRAVSVADRGSRGVVRYDALGRVTAGAIQIAKPGSAAPDPSARYTPRWYVTETAFDGAHRPVEATTGATLSELLGTAGRSVVTYQYSARGAVASVSSSYGTLLASSTIDADGRLLHAVLGDAAGTERSYGYDQLRRLSNVQLYRPGAELWTTPAYPVSSELTQQLLLEDYVFAYDPANNVTEITDYRIPDEWPAGAKPVTRNFEYDDTYRLTRTTFDYPGGGDPWTSPFAAENMASSSGPEPSPHVEFSGRIEEQQHKYDHLGNITESADDQNGFQDRSLGTQEHGSPDLGPHQLLSATNRAIAPTSLNQGDLETGYDAAGNLTDLVIRRDGPCLPAGSSCWQRYTYHWDELGQLDRAQRWDLAGAERIDNDQLGDPAPGRAADVELRYAYDSAGQRVLKTAVDPAGEQIHTVYISASYELRRTTFAGGDYELTRDTVALYVSGGGVRGRVLYSEEDLPSLSSGHQRLFLELGDHLGSSNVIIDHETGELVEYATYQPYGATESDYRPERWGQFREAYKFTGKEEDVEVGLQYFGARYLVVGLQRWASPDPAAIHGIRAFNPYSYVEGRPLVAVDPDGRLAFLAVVAIAIVVSAVIAGGVSVGTQVAANDWDFSKRIDWGQVGIAAGTGAIVGGLSAATGGVAGTLVGGMFSSPVAGAIIGGAAGGAVGGATGYVGTWAVGNALGTETPEFSGWGLLGAAVAGAAVGAASASLAYKFGGEPAAALDKDTVYDGTTVDATKDFGERYHDASVLEKREYYTTTWEKDGQTLLKQPAAGPPCSDLECGPPSDAELARLTESPGEGWKFTGVEHTHPRSNEFSAQTPYDLGDEGSANALAANHDGAKSYMISPSDGVRSLPGPMPHGNWETNMSYVHRLSPRWGMMGTAAGTGIGTYLHPVKTENR